MVAEQLGKEDQPLIHLDVLITEANTAPLIIYEQDNPAEVTDTFCRYNSIGDMQRDMLYKAVNDAMQTLHERSQHEGISEANPSVILEVIPELNDASTPRQQTNKP